MIRNSLFWNLLVWYCGILLDVTLLAMSFTFAEFLTLFFNWRAVAPIRINRTYHDHPLIASQPSLVVSIIISTAIHQAVNSKWQFRRFLTRERSKRHLLTSVMRSDRRHLPTPKTESICIRFHRSLLRNLCAKMRTPSPNYPTGAGRRQVKTEGLHKNFGRLSTLPRFRSWFIDADDCQVEKHHNWLRFVAE